MTPGRLFEWAVTILLLTIAAAALAWLLANNAGTT